MRFIFVTAVWGDDFTNTWLNTCLPFQVPQLNLGTRDRFVVYTDIEQLMPTPFPAAGAIIRRFDVPHELHQYDKMSWLHNRAMEEWAGPNTCICFLSPDVLYADGAFDFARKQIATGKKAILVPMFRAMKDTIVPAITSANPINPRELLSLAFRHLHGLTDALFWDAVIFHSEWPSHVYFRAPYGIRGNCWHQHPFAIVLAQKIALKVSLDGDLLVKSGISTDDMCVVTDSDDFCAVEMTAARSHIPWPGERRSVEGIAAWARCNATPLDRWFFQQTMRWHSIDLPPQTAENESVVDMIVSQIAKRAVPEDVQWQKYSVLEKVA